MSAARVGVIGPGRVGTALAMALPGELYRVTAVAGRAHVSVQRFLAAVPGSVERSPEEVGRACEVVLLALPDDALVPEVRRLAAADAVRPGAVWLHTAGGHGLAALEPARLAGARVAACHPAQTFPDPETGRAALPGTAWAVTAGPDELGWAKGFVHALGGRPVEVAEANRTLYHAGLVVGANGASAVVAQARELLLAAGVDRPDAFLIPLVGAAVRNSAERGVAALTGPVRRGDAGTVAAHLEELRAVLPEAVEPYVALARLALTQARRAGLEPDRAAAVAALLGGDA